MKVEDGRETRQLQDSTCVVNCLVSTTRLGGLLNVHGRTRCPSRGWYAQKPHDKGEEAVGFMVSTTTVKEGGGKRGKDKARGLDTSQILL